MSSMILADRLADIQALLAERDLDGWLLYDFRGTNAIAAGLLGFSGLATRRIFAFVPRRGVPVALQHAIEPGPWSAWPEAWPARMYTGWRAFESELAVLVGGKRVAMEYSPGDAIPYLDRVPAGVLEMVRTAGATVVTSADLVSAIYATWTSADRASHERAAEIIRTIALEAIADAGRASAVGTPLTEHALQTQILEQFARAGLTAEHGPDVAASENAANPHYAPSADHPREIRSGDVLLIDLWARESRSGQYGVYADQTWMASMGTPSAQLVEVWRAVRDARDTALALLTTRLRRGADVRGAEIDDAARDVITARGYASHFWHRTGHSIDARELHGSGPQIDHLESRDDRVLIPGVGFSVEPGVYLPGVLGVRSEVNCLVLPGDLLITPREYQRDLIVV
jgi:Xaa-Pro aminopeptidase